MDFSKKLSFLILFITFFVPALLFCQSQTGITVQITEETSNNQPDEAGIYWGDWVTANTNYVEQRSLRAPLPPGDSTIEFKVPTSFTHLRVDPGNSPSVFKVKSIKIKRFGIPVKSFSTKMDFEPWKPLHGISRFEFENSRLTIRATDSDPYFHIKNLDLKNRIIGVDLFLAAIFALFNCLIVSAFFGGRQPQQSGKAKFRKPGSWRLFFGTTLACMTVLCAFYFLGAKQSEFPASVALACELYLVDHRGNDLKTINNGKAVKIVLDPHTFYKTFPNQKEKQFSTDQNGFRDGLAAAKTDGLLLGGSAAFSCGASQDKSALHGQITQYLPHVHVFNGGTIGFLSGQELAQMMFIPSSFSPKFYAVFDGFNDFINAYIPPHQEVGNKVLPGANLSIFIQVENKLRTEKSLAESFSSKTTGENTWLEISLQTYEKNIVSMAKLAKLRNAKFYHFFQPFFGGKRHIFPDENRWTSIEAQTGLSAEQFNRAYNEYYSRLKRVLDREGIVSANLNTDPEIQEFDGQTFIDAMHMNDQGLKLTGKRIADIISQDLQKH